MNFIKTYLDRAQLRNVILYLKTVMGTKLELELKKVAYVAVARR